MNWQNIARAIGLLLIVAAVIFSIIVLRGFGPTVFGPTAAPTQIRTLIPIAPPPRMP